MRSRGWGRLPIGYSKDMDEAYLQNSRPLKPAFYRRSADLVAPKLLGCCLVRVTPEGITTGWIVETEAYLPDNDPASHAARGQTPSNRSMFAAPGTAYVYPIHAKHCFNVATDREGIGSAVLIRAVEPCCGDTVIESRRGTARRVDWCRGPARLCQAFAIDRQLDGRDMTTAETLWITQGLSPPRISRSPRIGVTSAQESPLRFFVDGNRYVSGRRGDHSSPAVESLSDLS